jgi:hypothetical protein
VITRCDFPSDFYLIYTFNTLPTIIVLCEHKRQTELCFKISWPPFSIWQLDENHSMRTEKNQIKIKRKVRLCEHLAIQLTYVASLRSQTENHTVLQHLWRCQVLGSDIYFYVFTLFSVMLEMSGSRIWQFISMHFTLCFQ